MGSGPFSYVNVSFVVFACEIAELHDPALSKQEERDFAGAAVVGWRAGGMGVGGWGHN